ncbi:leucine-rich repeat neuronal protein 1 [Culex quinquefasciatus]|uniref:leucine-rich repeat neuronal protein 1 n=1 Tax=Culex quinquefasciatus TaxID=7176 RepID=UPI0018E39920|nr:leucine-rich repeat neuronal protein 1 [Culex quinquefasciatus]XP_038109181.1 leucine-rich repeat neuronal protein 1 [Culex quinquefasciatus]XP_038109182.1 leucine-rich repeat neuronal protein 1 [Culex quinquefasciatus]
MKLFSKVLLISVAVCSTLVLAAEDDQSKASNSTKDDTSNATKKQDQDTDQKLPNPLCASCTCDAPQKTFKCSSMKLSSKLFNTTGWASLNDYGVAVDVMLLDRNGITEVPVFPNLDVRVLDLSHNNISVIAKKAFFALSKLEVLDLSYNMLTTKSLVPAVFEGPYSADDYEPLGQLRVLRLGYNQLHSLDANLFEHMPNLQELSLVSNVFKTIDTLTENALSSVRTLLSLDLSYMELNSVPGGFLNAIGDLTHLNLTGNLLETIPEGLRFAQKLKWLSLDENPIGNIQGDHVFPALKSLEYLSLSYMSPLKVIGRGAFSGLQALQEVHISNNPVLSYLHVDAFAREDPDDPTRQNWPRVKRFYLHNNNLSTLDAQLLTHWAEMELVDIRQNPWNCDCDNQWLVETLVPVIEKTTPNTLNNIVCTSPQQMAGQSMVELQHKHSQLRCGDKYGNNPAGDGALLIGLLIGVLAGIPLTAAVILIYRRGCFGLVRRGPADYSRAFYSRATNDDF